MSVCLYLDHHVPRAVSEQLRERGIDVVTAQQDGFAQRDDFEILLRCERLSRVLYTQDEDFLVLARELQKSQQVFAGIVFGRQLTMTVGKTVEDLETLCQVMSSHELQSQVVFLPL